MSAPATSPKSNGGSHWIVAASATTAAFGVSDATSSGPAASATPSPRLVVHDEASSHWNPLPSRAGTTPSTRLRTGR